MYIVHDDKWKKEEGSIFQWEYSEKLIFCWSNYKQIRLKHAINEIVDNCLSNAILTSNNR